MFWYLCSIAAVLVVCAMRIVREPRFFFWDDTQLGAFGQWYGLGSRLLAGEIPLLSPGHWQGGNYLAEGQWGIWNPVTWIVAIGTHLIDGATVYTTLVKIAFLVALATGAFLLAREYGASPWWAAVAGFTATMGGQTIFMDAPSWVTGLQNVALFALCWWALKRHVSRGASPFPFFVFAYLLVTFGYVFGVIELAVLLLLFLVASRWEGAWVSARRVLVLGAFSGLLTVFVYLPGLLTSPVTTRSGSQILNDQFLNMDLGDLATSSITTATSSVHGYWGDLVPVPLQYVTWLLPLFVLVLPATARVLRSLVIPAGILVVTLAFVLGPSVLGPIRYPARMMPYAVLCVAIIFAVLASRRRDVHRPSRARVQWAMGLTALAGWLAWAAQPSSWAWVLLATALQIAIIAALFLPWRGRVLVAASPQRVAASILIGSLVVLAPQVARYASSPLGNFNVPSSVSAMQAVGDDIAEGVMAVGDVYSLQAHPESYRESLIANLWYLTGEDAASVYTVLPFTAFAEDLCIDLRGYTCPDALDVLFRDREHPLVDDMALNSVVVIKGNGLETRPDAPRGWTVEDREFTWVLHRDVPVETAGDVARASEGLLVETIDRTDTSVTVSIDSVPPEGGDIVFSRLAWPGYTTNAGSIADPERGYLLTVHVDAADEGETLTIQFRPPGWAVEVASAIAAGLIGIGWSLSWVAGRRRAAQRGSMWEASTAR
ncbi:hypothetical protein [Microbacterium ulmi]|uniref:Membrane protein YfhO n=1 Tax=Microbacterium ulmi TaxID=179095 RepID=A0A7Y2LYX3_9MICO|nr:hypothetical protein [Microbacterium ulmi]NII70358.1 hypothetical protein [Microbacterium ulmi]NNH03406.1 hypothetical protein [Microbacterium ulmi]